MTVCCAVLPQESLASTVGSAKLHGQFWSASPAAASPAADRDARFGWGEGVVRSGAGVGAVEEPVAYGDASRHSVSPEHQEVAQLHGACPSSSFFLANICREPSTTLSPLFIFVRSRQLTGLTSCCCIWHGAGAVGELESLTGTLEAQLLRLLQAQGGEGALAAAQSRLPPSRSPEALAARRFDSSSGSDDGAPTTPGKGILSAVEAVLHSPASQRSAGRGSRRRTPSSSARASHLQRGALHLSASQREGREVENVFRVLAQQMRAHRKLFGQVRSLKTLPLKNCCRSWHATGL